MGWRLAAVFLHHTGGSGVSSEDREHEAWTWGGGV